MKVAVAVTDPIQERDVIAQLRSQGHDVVKRCLDESDLATVPPDVAIYADARFHSLCPRSIPVSDIEEPLAVTTRTIGVVGPTGSPGVSTLAINVAVALHATLIDAAQAPAIASHTGQREGQWFGAEIITPPLPPLRQLLSRITTSQTVIDLGFQVSIACDELLVVVNAHPISVERYLIRLSDFGVHRLVLNRMDGSPIAKTAKRMLLQHCPDISEIPRDDRTCSDAFIGAKPLGAVGAKTEIVAAINRLYEPSPPRRVFSFLGREPRSR